MHLTLALLLCACTPPTDTSEPVDTGDTTDTGEEAPLTHAFSFAVFADTHMYGSAESEARATAAVDWVNQHATERDIQLVLVVGDIAWNSGLDTVRDVFAPLPVPWVPVTGDNEVHSGDEGAFYTTMQPQWEALAGDLTGWSLAPAPIHNPEYDQDSWFTNLRFEHGGVRFVGLDWGSRSDSDIFGEMADLQDFEGATLPWLEESLVGCEEAPIDSVVLFSHHPMHLFPGAFDQTELDTLIARLAPWGDALYADFAGHYHVNMEDWPAGASWGAFVTDAIWDDELTIRVVEVSANGRRFAYEHELVVVE
ncbi:MAG: metallophosphoesterase [Pseudomonadota bacterium]